MSTIQGLPVHVLLVHFVVVLVPLTAALAILSALWPAARRRLIWLIVILATAIVIITPLTTEAGEWLEHRIHQTDVLREHTALGDTMLYFALSLLLGTVLLAFAHRREQRQRPLPASITAAIAAIVVVSSGAATIQVYRIGESGARSAWSDEGAAPANP
ncbi:MAG: DUF2231 domain-containing protein [Mycobacterium sp.]|nr:DUF2231 domain-containing protein [Mycobacterium sp.]